MTLYETIAKVNGPIMPIGDCREDAKRLENLKQLVEVMDVLHRDIDQIASMKDCYQASIKSAAKVADDFLDGLGIEE